MMFSIISYYRNASQSDNEIPLHTHQMGRIQKTDNASISNDTEKLANSNISDGNVNSTVTLENSLVVP